MKAQCPFRACHWRSEILRIQLSSNVELFKPLFHVFSFSNFKTYFEDWRSWEWVDHNLLFCSFLKVNAKKEPGFYSVRLKLWLLHGFFVLNGCCTLAHRSGKRNQRWLHPVGLRNFEEVSYRLFLALWITPAPGGMHGKVTAWLNRRSWLRWSEIHFLFCFVVFFPPFVFPVCCVTCLVSRRTRLPTRRKRYASLRTPRRRW